jgi:hypothetical protein
LTMIGEFGGNGQQIVSYHDICAVRSSASSSPRQRP